MAQDLENTMVDNNVYILTDINPNTTNNLIMRLTQWVNGLKFVSVKDTSKKIYTPYEEIPEHIPTLNVWINSGGGKANLLQSILSMFHLASAKGSIIKTYNLRQASSSASMIAISGTYGYRYMAEDAFNFIHFGQHSTQIAALNEIEYAIRDCENFSDETRNIYLKNTKLTKEELNTYYSVQNSGLLLSAQCLEKSLCDWVITNDGRFVNNIKELNTQQR